MVGERLLGFRIDWRKVGVLVSIPVVVVILFLYTGGQRPETPRQTFAAEEAEFLRQVEEGKIEPVLTQEIRITSKGIEPRFSLVRYTPEIGKARVSVVNADSVKRTVVIGQNDVYEMRPGFQFTLTFGQATETEIWDRDSPEIRGKIFVR